VPPLEPIADDDDRISAPVWYYDEEPTTTPETIVGRTYNPDYAEELAAAEAEMAAAEAPPPPAPSAPPEPSVAPPSPPPQPEVRRLRLATDTYFHFDRAQLTSAGRAELDKLVAEMGSANISAISIVGYADRIGSDAYNLKLSQRRADAVRQYLAEREVAANRMRAIGRGKSDPVTASGACKGLASKRLIQCLAPDRRVEIEVVGLAAPAR
jgi:OOP family OmpA-OmpF porin